MILVVAQLAPQLMCLCVALCPAAEVLPLVAAVVSAVVAAAAAVAFDFRVSAAVKVQGCLALHFMKNFDFPLNMLRALSFPIYNIYCEKNTNGKHIVSYCARVLHIL